MKVLAGPNITTHVGRLTAGLQRATVQLVGQNGKTHDFRPVVGNGCKAHGGGGGRHHNRGKGKR